MSNDDNTGSIHDTDTLLRRAVDIIANARTIPLSSSPMINRDEIIELLEEALNRLPDELRQARWMLKERQEFLNKTRREAEDILDAARAQAERMVQRTEVVRAAELRGRQVMEAAESQARQMKLETEDFVDQRLASFEIVLNRVVKTVAVGREKLNSRAQLRPEPAPAPDTDAGFFDQDRDARGSQVMANALLVNVAELLRHPGSRRTVALTLPLADLAPDGLRVVDARVPADAEVGVELELEALSAGAIVVTGRVEAPWTAACRRCLGPAGGELHPEVREVYRTVPEPDDDAFPMTGEQVDLVPLVREALTLELPLAPVCRDDCAGLCPVCGADLNAGDCGCERTVTDPRWGVLDALKEQLERDA